MESRIGQNLVQYFSPRRPFSSTFFGRGLGPLSQGFGRVPPWRRFDSQLANSTSSTYVLGYLTLLSKLMHDPDQTLFPSLIAGVGTGFQHDIPLSNCFPINNDDAEHEPPLSAHHCNWQSADDDPTLTRALCATRNRQGVGL